MKILAVTMILAIGAAACATGSIANKESLYAPISTDLPIINQKIAAHFTRTGIPEGFDTEQYKAAVKEVCFPNPYCRAMAEAIFSSFEVKARKVDGILSVMLCDKGMGKIMEDLTCDNLDVEIKSWRSPDYIPCDFEVNWKEKCPR